MTALALAIENVADVSASTRRFGVEAGAGRNGSGPEAGVGLGVEAKIVVGAGPGIVRTGGVLGLVGGRMGGAGAGLGAGRATGGVLPAIEGVSESQPATIGLSGGGTVGWTQCKVMLRIS